MTRYALALLALLVVGCGKDAFNPVNPSNPTTPQPSPVPTVCVQDLVIYHEEHSPDMARTNPLVTVHGSRPVMNVDMLEDGVPYNGVVHWKSHTTLQFDAKNGSVYRIRGNTPTCSSWGEWTEIPVGDPNTDSSAPAPVPPSAPIPPGKYPVLTTWGDKTDFVFANNGDGLEFSFYPNIGGNCTLTVTALDHTHPEGIPGSEERLDVYVNGPFVGTTPDIGDTATSATGTFSVELPPNGGVIRLRRHGDFGSLHGAAASLSCITFE